MKGGAASLDSSKPGVLWTASSVVGENDWRNQQESGEKEGVHDKETSK